MELRITGWTFVKFSFNIIKKILLTILIFFAGILLCIPFWFVLGEGEPDFKIIYYLWFYPGKYKKALRQSKKSLKVLIVSVPSKYYIVFFIVVVLYFIGLYIIQSGKQ